jgi:hypothetical protein
MRKEFTAYHVFQTHEEIGGSLKGKKHVDNERMMYGSEYLPF